MAGFDFKNNITRGVLRNACPWLTVRGVGEHEDGGHLNVGSPKERYSKHDKRITNEW